MNLDDISVLLLQAILLVFISGSVGSLAFRKGKSSAFSFGASIAGSVLLIAFSVLTSFSGAKLHLANPLPAPIPTLAIEFYVDGISAFFMLVLGLVTLAVSIYSLGYSSAYSGKGRAKPLGFLFNFFVLSMLLVVASNSIFSFMVFWELMSLSSFFLVIYDHEDPTNIKSGMTYLVMTHIGSMFILASFLAFSLQTGSFSFDSFRSPSAMPHYIKDIAFALAFVGFGTKAGLVPLHRWLPEAHPSAPSNVSAMMSAVMVKVAIYGLVRTTFDFAAPSSAESAWWGMLLAASGAASCIIGVLYAAIEKDIKKALAYSTIENVGVIVLGLGLAVMFQSYGLDVLAGFALLASMYHTLNHAAFKSLLFMGAGSVVFRTGTKHLDNLGGIIKGMPLTALLFLIGALAISGLPPLNGFVSEWLMMQALLSSYQLPNLTAQISVSLISMVFALTVGLALATFVRIFGITFLARPRSDQARNARESPKSMIAGMAVAACFCLIFGIAPFVGTDIITSSFGLATNLAPVHESLSPFAALAVPSNGASFGSMSGSSIAVMLGCISAFLVGLFAVATKKTTRRIFSTWDCGFGSLDERTQYTASSLAQPIRTVFKSLYRPHTSVSVTYYADTYKYLKKSVTVDVQTKDVFDVVLYSPVTKATIAILNAVRRIQTGRINAYLLYIMIALAAMLIVAEVSP